MVVVAVLAATGCVGKRGRNDDPVAPGSEGKASVELSLPFDRSDLAPR